jgi:CheY-like chemotaxis protein
MNAEPTFLVAEDNENDILLLRHAFTKAGRTIPLTFVRDGQEAMDMPNSPVSGFSRARAFIQVMS